MTNALLKRALMVASAAMIAGCGGEKNTEATAPADAAPEAAGVTAEKTDANAAPAADPVKQVIEETVAPFIPEADQFGLQSFKIVYRMEGQQTGTRIMYVEDYGKRVALEEDLTAFNMTEDKITYWDGETVHLKINDGAVSAIRIRPITTEPSSFATTSAANLELVGYKRLGEKTILGKPCEHWRSEPLNFEGCRWNNIDLENQNGAGTDKVLQSIVAIEFVEGEGIPDHIKAIAK